MKNRREIQEKIISTPGFDRAGLETAEALLKPMLAIERTAGKANSEARIQPVSDRFPALEKQEVVFTFLVPEAREVHVAGDFNDWRSRATPLKNTGAGNWVVRLMLRSGRYEYRFIVDGRWCEDPGASERVANSYGGFNSILVVPLADQADIL